MSGGMVSADLQSIEVSTVDTRVGVIMRNLLLDRLTPDGAPISPLYRLVVRSTERQVGSGVRIDASVTRFNYRLIARYQLLAQPGGALLYSDSSTSVVAYDVVDSQFATVVSRKDAQERAAADVSDNIRLSLALYFQRRDTEPDVDVSSAE
jgi:LPS-assembly lipoprotein